MLYNFYLKHFSLLRVIPEFMTAKNIFANIYVSLQKCTSNIETDVIKKDYDAQGIYEIIL